MTGAEAGSLAAFFAMGGYWPFVWPSYVLSGVVLGVLVWRGRRRVVRLEAALADQGETPRRRRGAPLGAEEERP